MKTKFTRVEFIKKSLGLLRLIAPLIGIGLAIYRSAVEENTLPGWFPSWSWEIWVLISLVAAWLLLFEGAYRVAKNKDDKLTLDPKPDISARFALKHLIVDSKWALRKMPPGENNINDPDNFYPEIEGALRDAARSSRLKVWGREEPKVKGLGGFKNTLEEIPAEEWKSRRFDLPTCMDGRTLSACLGKFGGTILEDAMVNENQVLLNWPKATFYEKWRDPHFKNRVEFYRKENHIE